MRARWSDVGFTDATRASNTHVTVGGEVIEKGPKSRRGYKTLPLFQPVLGALLALYETQVAESQAVGAAYAVGAVDDGFVCCDQLGGPGEPADVFRCLRATVQGGRAAEDQMADCRHSANSLLEHLGVPDSIRASSFGHTVAVNVGTYTHVKPSGPGRHQRRARWPVFRGCVTRTWQKQPCRV